MNCSALDEPVEVESWDWNIVLQSALLGIELERKGREMSSKEQILAVVGKETMERKQSQCLLDHKMALEDTTTMELRKKLEKKERERRETAKEMQAARELAEKLRGEIRCKNNTIADIQGTIVSQSATEVLRQRDEGYFACSFNGSRTSNAVTLAGALRETV